jgi:hypothetical protein
MPGLCVNPCATNLALYLTTSLFSFLFQMNTHLNPTEKMLGGVGISSSDHISFLKRIKLNLNCFLPFILV